APLHRSPERIHRRHARHLSGARGDGARDSFPRVDQEMKETTEEKEEAVEHKAANGETVEVARVEKVKAGRQPGSRNRTAIVGVIAIVAIAALASLIWWWRTRSSEEGRPIPAPTTVVR